MNRPLRLAAPTLVLLAGAALRISPLTDNRFHPDEALFASYGRLISTGDWNLATRLVDKPPLAFYLMAGSFMRIGPNEVAARLPGLAASILSVALVWRLAMRLWVSRPSALAATLVMALSPMAVLFGPTAFTDPLLVTWLLAAMLAVSSGRWGWGGLLAGLALATKQNALLLLPLVAVLGEWRDADWRTVMKCVVRFALPLLVVAGLLVAWDATRGPLRGFWAAGVANNAPGGLAAATELMPRLRGWLGWLRYVGGWLPANVLLAGAALGLAAYRLHRWPRGWREVGLAAFVLAYLLAHWLLAVNVYDRYLLPLVPVLALLVGRGVGLAFRGRGTLAAVGLAALLVWPALKAARSAYPVGGDHGAYDGIDEVAAYLDGLPRGTLIYDHWLGWPLDFYLFDSPAYTTYFATPAELTAMLHANQPGLPAVLLAPAWQPHADLLQAASRAGYSARPVLETESRTGGITLVVYALDP